MSDDSTNPFKGLQSYGPDDSNKLFGRERDLILMKDRIFSGRTTLLFAGSGVGKTSFLNAKVIPELEGQYIAFYHSRWAGPAKPLEAVKTTLAARIAGAEKTERLINCFEQFVYKPPPQDDEADPEEVGGGVPDGQQCLLIFDQFEEIFQYHAYEDYFKRFLEEVCEVVRSDDYRVHLVISMREEYLGELSVFDNLIPDLFNNYYRLRYPNKRDAAQIIEGTCTTVGTTVDRANLKLLIGDLSKIEKGVATSAERSKHDKKAVDRVVERSFIIPPYLQIVCHRKWKEQASAESTNGHNGFVFLENYEANQAQTMLRDFCQEKLSALTFMEQNVAERSFDFLVTKQGAKMAYEFTSLIEHMRLRLFKGKLKSALVKLSVPETRILRQSHGPDGSLWFELYHDIYGKILDTWRASFRARKHRLAVLFGVIGLVALLILIPITWHWGIQPYNLKNVLRNAHLEKPEEYPNALESYKTLSQTWGYGSTANSLWADAWERRARYAESRNERDEAIISWLNALNINPGSPHADEWRLKAGNLVGDDYQFLNHRLSHDNKVNSAIFSGDGQFVVTQTVDQRIWVWDAKSGALVGNHPDPQSSVLTTEVQVKNQQSGKGIASKRQETSTDRGRPKTHRIHSAAVHPQLGWLVATTFNEDYTQAAPGEYVSEPVLVLSKRDELLSSSIQTGSKRSDYGYTTESVALSADGNFIATSGRGQETRVWKIQDGKAIPLKGFKSNGLITEVKFSQDGKSLLMENDKSQVLMWDVASAQLNFQPLSVPHKEKCLFGFDGASFIVSSAPPEKSGRVEQRSTQTGQLLRDPVPMSELRYGSLSITPDNTFVFFSSYSGQVWSAPPTGNAFQEIVKRNSSEKRLTSFSPMLDLGLSYEENDVWVHRIDLNSGRNPMLNAGETISDSVLSKDGTWIGTLIVGAYPTKDANDEWEYYGTRPRRVQVWDAKTLAPIGNPINNVIAFSENGEYAATVNAKEIAAQSRRGEQFDGKTVHILNVQTGAEVMTFSYPDRGLFSRLISGPGGRFFVTRGEIQHDYDATDRRLAGPPRMIMYIWDRTDTSHPIQVSSGVARSFEFKVAFSPDERFVAVADDNTNGILLWDLGLKHQLQLIRNIGQASTLVFNKHGQLVAAAEKKLRIWDLSTLEPVSELDLVASINAVALSSDGRTLIVGDSNGMVSSWRLASNGQITQFGEARHRDPATSIDFSIDEKAGIIKAANWLHTTNAADHRYVTSYFLGSTWRNQCQSLDNSGSQFRCLFELRDGKLQVKDIKEGVIQDTVPIEGDAHMLLELWTRRLGRKLDALGKIVPLGLGSVAGTNKNAEAAASPTASP